MKRVFIVAGDPSGDLIASQLVESLKKIQPGLHVTGVGGEKLKMVCDLFLADIVSQHALGFSISLKQILFFHHTLKNVIVPELKKNPPDFVIPVDFYGFNSRVAKMAKRMGHRVFYYASPQFWASRPYRAENLRPFVDLFLCLFPFEVDFYRQRNLPAQFVGHPIIDRLPTIASIESRPAHVEPLLGLLPGSRPEEIRRHLPIMRRACKIIAETHPRMRIVLFTVPHIRHEVYNALLEGKSPSPLRIELIQDENYKWRSQLDLAITASGMESLENTLLGIPMVVMYKTNWLTYVVVKSLIRISHIAMPNLLAGGEIVPELIQSKATPEAVAQPILHWLKNPGERLALRTRLLSLRAQMGNHGATDRAARTILEKVA